MYPEGGPADTSLPEQGRSGLKTYVNRTLAVLPQLKALLLALSLWSSLPAAAAPISRDDPESSDPSSGGISTARGSAVVCLLYTSPSPRDLSTSRMPSSA